MREVLEPQRVQCVWRAGGPCGMAAAAAINTQALWPVACGEARSQEEITECLADHDKQWVLTHRAVRSSACQQRYSFDILVCFEESEKAGRPGRASV